MTIENLVTDSHVCFFSPISVTPIWSITRLVLSNIQIRNEGPSYDAAIHFTLPKPVAVVVHGNRRK